MAIATTIARDFKRHRSKAAVLGVLFAVMIALSIRAALQLRPQAALASIATPCVAVMGVPTFGDQAKDDPLVGAEAEERIKQSRELWHRLREVKGPSVTAVFSFDASLYPPDPSRKAPVVTATPVEPALPAPAPQDNAETLRRATEIAVREQARALTVKSTTVSSGKPWAIVNQQLLSVGDHINGFEVTVIRSREVEFRKDGVTVPVKMPDEFRGQ